MGFKLLISPSQETSMSIFELLKKHTDIFLKILNLNDWEHPEMFKHLVGNFKNLFWLLKRTFGLHESMSQLGLSLQFKQKNTDPGASGVKGEPTHTHKPISSIAAPTDTVSAAGSGPFTNPRQTAAAVLHQTRVYSCNIVIRLSIFRPSSDQKYS